MKVLYPCHTVGTGPTAHSLFSVNEAQELCCPELFRKEGQSVLSGMGKASAREFRIPAVGFFPWAAASN